MRARVAVAFLLATLLAGCLAPSPRPLAPSGFAVPEVADVRAWELEVVSWDGTPLATTVLEPVAKPARGATHGGARGEGGAADRDGTDVARWPVVVFLHGWGNDRGAFRSLALRDEAGNVVPRDVLLEFAQAGFLAVAYDARGFGESGGRSTLAGPAELEDLRAVVEQVHGQFPTSGLTGLAGYSYGAGQALLSWAHDPLVATAAVQMGWVDLYDGLVPGDVPKMEWMQTLYALGQAGSGARLHPQVTDWYVAATTRDGLDEVEAALDLRSVGDALARTEKPLFVCQGMQETLFPQADLAWGQAAGFVRARVHPGGHGVHDAGCWDRTLAWFRFFLQGIDTRVDQWPPLETVDALRTAAAVSYPATPTATQTFHLRAPDLAAEPSSDTFVVEQRLVANPLSEPSVVHDQLGQPPLPVPAALHEDPAGVLFRSAPLERPRVLLGAAELRLVPAQNASGPFQVTAQLVVESAHGAQVLGHAAFAATDEAAAEAARDGVLLRFPWAKADLHAGDVLTLKVAANDPTWFMPLPAAYSVAFTGESRLDVPFFAP